MALEPRNQKTAVEPTISDAAMAQLYRGELGRSDRWRMRLDNTTNWALTTTAAVVSFSFSAIHTSHVTLLVGIWMVGTFMLIEARRYRYYDLWIRRVRLMEDGYWAPLLRQEPMDPDAIKELALEMSRPQLQLSLFAAVATRMNRAYGPLLLVLLLTWFVKLYTDPVAAPSLAVFVERAHVGFFPGALLIAVLSFLTLFLAALFVSSHFARPPMGELTARHRPRRMALWESFSRPYAVKSPRRQKRAPPKAPTAAIESSPARH